jgi:hypothetical protein
MDFRISTGFIFFRSGRRAASSWLLLGDEAAYDLHVGFSVSLILEGYSLY